MAALQIQNEEQLKKAETLIRESEIELRDPLLGDSERTKLETKVSRLKVVIEAYRTQLKPPEKADDKRLKQSATITIQQASYPTQEPRPDLTEDAALWATLLLLADEKDREANRVYGEVDTLCGVLNGFRCGGTRLKAGKVAGSGLWVLKPDIDPSGKAWESQAEYDDFKERYLKQWGQVIPELLKEVTKRHPLPGGTA